jgi:hypothetical protein
MNLLTNTKCFALLAATLSTTTLFAAESVDKAAVAPPKNEPISFEIQPHWTGLHVDSRDSRGKWSSTWNNTESLSLTADFGNGWDAEVETGFSRNAEPDQDWTGYTELKVRYSWELSQRWECGLQIGIGDGYFVSGPSEEAPDVAYWLAQARMKYHVSDRFRLRLQYEIGSALNPIYGNTFGNTVKLGYEYDIIEHLELGTRFVTQFAQDVRGNGIEVLLTYKF